MATLPCAPESADRCQATLAAGQCSRTAQPGSEYCSIHGNTALKEAEARRQYLLTKVEDRRRMGELADHEHVKSLRDEIAMARMLVERRFNMIRGDADLMAACAPLNQLFLTIEKLVKTCHGMEQSLGTLLSRSMVLSLGQNMAQTVIEELKGIPDYELVVDRIIERIFQTIETNEQATLPE